MKHSPILLAAASIVLALTACCNNKAAGSGVLPPNHTDLTKTHGVEASPVNANGIMPVTGTWINLAWQDERNNYTNFQDEVKNTDPAMWDEKMRALHAIGVDYIAFAQVANEGKAYYPSTIMEHHYPDGRMSPVEAILNTCDELGMHVFMSCGWAKNQLDNVGDQKVIDRQCEIMRELAALYGDRPSFYGWYLPIEDCLVPYLPERSIPSINRLTATAHEITPGKKTLVSPWGIYGADLDNPKFAENLSKIDVDIIAYQDEVGCVRETFPINRMKHNFRKLGKIHEKLGIEFWVNIESFTWDRGTNNWYSSLIPAQFGRYLSQIVSASQSGAKRIISFAVYGMYEAPGAQYPLGQPEESVRAYETYQAWLAGDPHWKLLEDIFSGNARNSAKGCAVAYTGTDIKSHKDARKQAELQKLTDGAYGYEDPGCTDWVTFSGGMDVVIDLGAKHDVKVVAPRFIHYNPAWVRMPANLQIYTSDNGEDWILAAEGAGPHVANFKHDCWTDIARFEGIGEARYLRVVSASSLFNRIGCDEILVEY